MPFGLIRIGRKIFDFKLRDWLGEWNYYLKLHNFSACSLFTGIRLASGGAGVSTANSVSLKEGAAEVCAGAGSFCLILNHSGLQQCLPGSVTPRKQATSYTWSLDSSPTCSCLSASNPVLLLTGIHRQSSGRG